MLALICFCIATILFVLASFDVHPKCVNVGLAFFAFAFVILNWKG